MRKLTLALTLGLALANGALADTIILNGRDVHGTSRTDSLGYTHSEFSGGKYVTKCVSHKDSLGYTHTDCHSN